MKTKTTSKITDQEAFSSQIVAEIVVNFPLKEQQLRSLIAHADELTLGDLILWLDLWKPWLKYRIYFNADMLDEDEFLLWLEIHRIFCIRHLKAFNSDFSHADFEEVLSKLTLRFYRNRKAFGPLTKKNLCEKLKWVKEDYRIKFKKKEITFVGEYLPVTQDEVEGRNNRKRDISLEQVEALEICTLLVPIAEVKRDRRKQILIELIRKLGSLELPKKYYPQMTEEEKAAFLPDDFCGGEVLSKKKVCKELSRKKAELVELLQARREAFPEKNLLWGGQN